MKRISEVEDELQQSMDSAGQQTLLLQHREAELAAAKQSVRSAVVKYMNSTPASTPRYAKPSTILEGSKIQVKVHILA